nr:cell wall protein RBR3-like isoform X1 [Rhipicephalus microplus]
MEIAFPRYQTHQTCPVQNPPTFLFAAKGQNPNAPSGPPSGLKETSASEMSPAGMKTVSAIPSTGQTGPLVSDVMPGFSSAQPPASSLVFGIPSSLPPSASSAQDSLSQPTQAQLPVPLGRRADDSPNTYKPRQLSDGSTPTLPPGMVHAYSTESPISARDEKSSLGSAEEDESEASTLNSSSDEASEGAETASSTSESGPEDDSGKGRHARQLPPGLALARRGKDEKPHRVAPMSRRSARESESREPVVEEKIVP